MTSLDFSVPKHTHNLWQQISLHWSHRESPVGQRFLGSVRIDQKATDHVLDIVGNNLRKSSKITYEYLDERFYEPEQNWLKILTFALSEYAYYYSSGEKFWDGFCQRLKLPYSPSKEITFRKIVGEGFKILGLVQAKGGYRYVSTLWLQSGIPKQNLNHFAQLVQEFSNEYGWWEIAHTSYEDLSEELFDFCQEKHPQWRTLINFLKASCSQHKEEEIEPISGQLLQGIAVVAGELERQGVLPERLKNDNEREQLLGNYYLPNNFFLRNWDSLIRVLTPKERRQGSGRKIISRSPKPLSLILDVADSLNVQLLLPEQNLWKKGWERLDGTFCQILEVPWEGTILTNPGLMIPEQVIDIRNVAELWKWQLLDHRSNCLIEWKLEGVASDFVCLIFDAWTGDRLNLDPANPTLRGTKEIICFTPKGVHLDFGNGIEILDSCVPSSIRGWVGQQLTLTNKESSIVFSSENTNTAKSISWTLSSNEQPSLRGLQLKGKKTVYLEIPTFWYPAVDQEISLNVFIENMTRRQTIISTTEKVPPSNSWQSIPLDKWITESGKYEARFWNHSQRWSYKFEIKSSYQITDKLDINDLRISSLQGQVEKLPISYDYADKFWAEEVQIERLLPLEIINLSLSDKQETVFSQGQADSSGNLRLNLASFYDLLSPDSDWYALRYQRLGGELQRLIEMEIAPLSISWNWTNQEIYLSGLSSDESYSLSCWNLLLPENPPVEIKIPLIPLDEDTITVQLELQAGIYHIQLVGSRKLHHNLGWWCGSNQPDLPDEALENEGLENYCYTILGEESVQDFVNAAVNFDYEYQLLQTVTDSLHNCPCHFPEWLHSNSLAEKLQALLAYLKIKVEISCLPKQKVALGQTANNKSNLEANASIWLLVALTNNKKREYICKLIKKIINAYKLQDEISSVKIHEDLSLNYILFLECSNTEVIYRYIKPLEYIQKIAPMKPEESQRMLKGLKNVK